MWTIARMVARYVAKPRAARIGATLCAAVAVNACSGTDVAWAPATHLEDGDGAPGASGGSVGATGVGGALGGSMVVGGASGGTSRSDASNTGAAGGSWGIDGSTMTSSTATVGPDRPPKSKASWVYIDGYRLMVGMRQKDGTLPTPTPYKVKGVSWSPMPAGQQNTDGYTQYYTQYAPKDAPLFAGLSANTVRTYNAFEVNAKGLAVLDTLYANGVMVIMTVLASTYDAQGKGYLNAVNYFKGHPAILMWSIGNELNYNHLYNGGVTLDQAVQTVRIAIDDIHQADGEHPVTVSWGNAPTANYLSVLAHTDIWSMNLYPYLDLSTRFSQWMAVSKQPVIVGEYGADAWNANLGREDQDSQAEATTKLTQQIQAYYSALIPTRPVIGGCIFEFADEWWKASGNGATPSKHDVGGFANSGVYPDGIANEEWWGIVTVDRQPRKTYDALKMLYANP